MKRRSPKRTNGCFEKCNKSITLNTGSHLLIQRNDFKGIDNMTEDAHLNVMLTDEGCSICLPASMAEILGNGPCCIFLGVDHSITARPDRVKEQLIAHFESIGRSQMLRMFMREGLVENGVLYLSPMLTGYLGLGESAGEQVAANVEEEDTVRIMKAGADAFHDNQ